LVKIPIGTLKANLREGRAFRTSLPVLERPFFRLVGFGPFLDGTGQFTSPVGMLTVNGALSLEAGVFTAMYLLRISDPLRRFQTGTP
jgi:hypothetical protein